MSALESKNPSTAAIDPEDLLTVEEVADRLKVPRTWVYGAVRGRARKKLPHVRIGRYIRFEEAAVRAFIESSKEAYPPKSRADTMGAEQRSQ